jgi:hypothetical protein
MALIKTLMPEPHPTTGQPWYHVRSDDASKVLLFTGPAAGNMTLADGTLYNVNEDVIECDSVAHAHEVACLIGQQHEQTGRYDVSANDPSNPTGEDIPFLHGPCPHCGAGEALVRPAPVKYFKSRAEEQAARKKGARK